MGKTVKIYMEDDDYKGIKTINVQNWSGQAISTPIASLKKLKERGILQTPGVYFIFGIDIKTGKEIVYIGEAENPIGRLSNHERFKDDVDWREAVIFNSRSGELNKGHIKFLESKLAGIALGAMRYDIQNGNSPQCPRLNPGDVDAMFEFIDFIKIIFNAISHQVLEPIYQPLDIETSPIVTGVGVSNTKVFLGIGKVKATGFYKDGKINVHKGSEVNINTSPSMGVGNKKQKEKLIVDGILLKNSTGDKYIFNEDYKFNSSSAAASIISGNSSSGLWYWKVEDGLSLGEYLDSVSIVLEQHTIQGVCETPGGMPGAVV